MSLKSLDPAVRRRNVILALVLTLLIGVLVFLALGHVSPEQVQGHDSILTR